MAYRCLFEQSGTFKGVLRYLGFDAFDYDICDDFGQTDFVCDLFHEIEAAYDGEPSIFDGFAGDTILAFFPCVRFSAQAQFLLRCSGFGQSRKSDAEKCLMTVGYHTELHRLYVLLNKLVAVCLRFGLPLVIENPYKNSYLVRYWCFSPSVIVMDRRDYGDWYQKPTAFWFFNLKPMDNVYLWPVVKLPSLRITEEQGIRRSLISPYFVFNFVTRHLIRCSNDVDPVRFIDLSCEKMGVVYNVRADN